ncbi:MAG TPA: LytTR family transcriptional regulator DNA-binding domain-containing protein [Bacteroidales bacterium]|nr:LytTR family transcriptional regulator DNA-binding domain-containing protein [Bacteroidales bacterium]HPS61649.1 LytTR family transcriptional regulator DNA-binding domain-containing protein [Bacteroidales bacterium]
MLPTNEFYRISRSIIINVGYLAKVSRKKREAVLIKDGREYRLPIPLLNIRKLERFLEV